MKTLKVLATAFSAVALALTLAPISRAQCGVGRPAHAMHSGWHPQLMRPGQARSLTVGMEDIRERDSEAIVGFWHVKFISEGSEGIPDGTEIDAGYSQWHSDGTEIMNSGGHAPITSAFCLGVWEKVEPGRYKLNHRAIAWDPTGAYLVGPGTIQEDVKVAPDRDHFSGTFINELYDESGNRLVHAIGKITGIRIKVSTPVTSVF